MEHNKTIAMKTSYEKARKGFDFKRKESLKLGGEKVKNLEKGKNSN